MTTLVYHQKKDENTFHFVAGFLAKCSCSEITTKDNRNLLQSILNLDLEII